MNDTERLTRLHTNLVNELASNQDVQLRRAGLETEEHSMLTFFQLFFDPSDLTSWISRYRSCVNTPIPQVTIGTNADLWNKLYTACANIGIDWPGKEDFITRKAKNFQAKFDESIRKRYSRENEEIVKLQDQLRAAKEQTKNAVSRVDDMQTRINEMQSLAVAPADIASLFHERITLFTDQYDTCANRLDEYCEQERAIHSRMTAISESIHQAKSTMPQFVQILKDARSEYNAVFDAMKSIDEDTEQLNIAHQKVIKAAQRLHKHQSAIQEFETLYNAEGNAMTAVKQNIEALPLRKEYLEKALQALLVAGKLLGFDGEVELESIFQTYPVNPSDIQEEELLSAELRGLLRDMSLFKIIGPRKIKLAKQIAKAFGYDTSEAFVEAILTGDLERKAQEVFDGTRKRISTEAVKEFIETTLRNLKKRWSEGGVYSRPKLTEFFHEKSAYNPLYGRTSA